MCSSPTPVNASEAARRLGVSIKALRLYEQHDLLAPRRTAAGYRAYAPDDLVRAAEIVSLRALGLSLNQVAHVLNGDLQSLKAALSAQEIVLNDEIHELVRKLEKLRHIQADLAQDRMPPDGDLTALVASSPTISTAFELPWPWDGEWFELSDIRPLNYIIGSLGSGKTRLALRLAETLADAAFIGLDRLDNGGAAAKTLLQTDCALKLRVMQTMEWLVDEGATESDALIALIVGLETEGPSVLVVDMVEQDLDRSTQEALINYLRHRASAGARPLFLMTRSSAILDLTEVGTDEAILLCPANHSPPRRVQPYPGAPGYEAVATCLASPEVRARIAHCPAVV